MNEYTGELPPLPEPDVKYSDGTDYVGNTTYSQAYSDEAVDRIRRASVAHALAQATGAVKTWQVRCDISRKPEGQVENAMASQIADLRAALAQSRAGQGDAVLTPLDYRAQGREETLAIILAEDPEDPFSECTESLPNGDAGDYSGHWDENKLRALLHIGDCTHDAFGRAESAYWESTGHKEEAERMMRMVQAAPYFQPLHDFLAQHQQWGLLHDLQNAHTPAPQQGQVPDISAMVNRFLGWKLPQDFHPDSGITFTPIDHPLMWPVGTNLFTADQAKAMFEYCLAAAPAQEGGK